jgi:cytochrome c peroxidase
VGASFPVPDVPLGNPLTAEKALLGKVLFWDEQLSSTRTVSCGTCHIPGAGGSDPRDQVGATPPVNPGADGLFGTPDDVLGSPGVIASQADGTYTLDAVFGLDPQVTGRKAPSMINAAFFDTLFWDGRADAAFEDPLTGGTVQPQRSALESQAAGPPVSDAEMGHAGRDWADVAARVAQSRPLDLLPALPADLAAFVGGSDYSALFQQVFGTSVVTPVRVIQAIATYERTLISDQAPFDAFVAGTPGALTPQEANGLAVFNRAGCARCHGGPVFSDGRFHDIGVRPENEDVGREAVTGVLADRGRFRTPTLRNVGLRAPYFHNGGKATLEEVVDFYDRGGDFANPGLAPEMQPLGLTPIEKADLVAFLRGGLTDPRVENELPPFDRPLLYAESALVPQAYGAGSPAPSGLVPALVAVEPPRIGNPNLTLGMQDGPGGAPACLLIDVQAAPLGFPVAGATSYLALSTGVTVAATPTLAGAGPGQGFTSVVFAVPDDPTLIGQQLYAQWFVPTLPFGTLAATEAVQVGLF